MLGFFFPILFDTVVALITYTETFGPYLESLENDANGEAELTLNAWFYWDTAKLVVSLG